MADHDLAALWDAHCRSEFETRDVDATMATMIGGVGQDQLQRFYKCHFIGTNPADLRLIPVSRTVGADRVVDERVYCFTHTSEIDWMRPGLPPTGRTVEIPFNVPTELLAGTGACKR